MNNKVKYILAFSAGVATGVAISWRFLKKKYELIAQEEIDSVKEAFGVSREERIDEEPKQKTEKEQYEQIAQEYAGEKNGEESFTKPYVISPEEAGSIDDYDTTTFYYYADGVLTTLDDTIVEDVDNIVGSDFMNHFGEYEDDSVWIRNDNYLRDYEILRDSRNYADIKKPVRDRETEE